MIVRKKEKLKWQDCVQVIDKSSGKYREPYTVGSSFDKEEIETFDAKAIAWILNSSGSWEIDF